MNDSEPNATDLKRRLENFNLIAQGDNENALNSKNLSLLRKIQDILILINRARKQLEDLSIERRTQISEKQSSIVEKFKSSSTLALESSKFLQKSLLTRIYFVDKECDDIFQNVMKYSLIFCRHLNQFNEKVLKNNVIDENLETLGNKEDATTKQSNLETEMSGGDNRIANSNIDSPINISDENENTESSEEKIQKSLTSLMMAKVEFDSKFLNFNAILNKTCFSEDFLYKNKFCSNCNMILEEASLSIDKWKSQSANKKKVKRKRLSSERKDKNPKRQQLRKSIRISSMDDSSEVHVIHSHSLRRKDNV